MLHNSVYGFRDIVMYDDYGHTTQTDKFAMLLPGQVVEIKHPDFPDDPTKSIWRHHTHVCAPESIVDDSIAPCPEPARRRFPGETFQNLIADYPIELVAQPYLAAYPDVGFAPIIAAGYLTRERFLGIPGGPGSDGDSDSDADADADTDADSDSDLDVDSESIRMQTPISIRTQMWTAMVMRIQTQMVTSMRTLMLTVIWTATPIVMRMQMPTAMVMRTPTPTQIPIPT